MDTSRRDQARVARRADPHVHSSPARKQKPPNDAARGSNVHLRACLRTALAPHSSPTVASRIALRPRVPRAERARDRSPAGRASQFARVQPASRLQPVRRRGAGVQLDLGQIAAREATEEGSSGGSVVESSRVCVDHCVAPAVGNSSAVDRGLLKPTRHWHAEFRVLERLTIVLCNTQVSDDTSLDTPKRTTHNPSQATHPPSRAPPKSPTPPYTLPTPLSQHPPPPHSDRQTATGRASRPPSFRTHPTPSAAPDLEAGTALSTGPSSAAVSPALPHGLSAAAIWFFEGRGRNGEGDSGSGVWRLLEGRAEATGPRTRPANTVPSATAPS
ncbi:hypothetical protein VTO73DRAFT_4538 [Trametes versicolor]